MPATLCLIGAALLALVPIAADLVLGFMLTARQFDADERAGQ